MASEQPAPRRRNLGRAIVALILLAPLALTLSLFAFTAEGRAVAVDAALSLGLGGPVEGTIRYDDCAYYVDGDYPGSKNIDRGTRCTMVIEAGGERADRPIDLDHVEALRQVRQPGRVFGALGAAMPAGAILDRLGRFGTLIFFSAFLAGALAYLLWSTRRRRQRRAD